MSVLVELDEFLEKCPPDLAFVYRPDSCPVTVALRNRNSSDRNLSTVWVKLSALGLYEDHLLRRRSHPVDLDSQSSLRGHRDLVYEWCADATSSHFGEGP